MRELSAFLNLPIPAANRRAWTGAGVDKQSWPRSLLISVLFILNLAAAMDQHLQAAEQARRAPGQEEGQAELQKQEVGAAGAVKSESNRPQEQQVTAEQNRSSDPAKLAKRWEFVGTPIPVINPTVGNGLAGAGGLLVRLDPQDTVSPPSIFGAGAAFTSNGTWAYGILAELFLKQDRFRITGLFGDGHVNYDYYGRGSLSNELNLFVPLSINGLFFLVEPKVRMFERWYAGPRYRFLSARVGLNWDEIGDQLPWIPDLGLGEELSRLGVDVRSAALGLRVERDTRDSQFYPRKGSFVDLKLDFFDSSFGSIRNYQTRNLSGAGFVGFKAKNVIAWRVSACSASDDTPFYDLCMLGKAEDLRGYAVGKYQNHSMLAGQVEYRRELIWRLGTVAYLGAGEVAKSFSEMNWDDILPGGGIGARFTLSKESHINLRIDYAWGKESSALYVSIMEAF